MSSNETDIKIRPALNPKECAVVGDIYQQACSHLRWHRHVNSDVDPETMKKSISRLANVIRKTYHGIVVLAELNGKIVGYLLAWEEKPGNPDPYRHKSVNPNIPGRRMTIWWSLHNQIDKVCNQVQDNEGPFLCKFSFQVSAEPWEGDVKRRHFPDVDEIAVLPEYQGFGIGRKLLDYTAKAARVYGLPVALMAAPGKLWCRVGCFKPQRGF